jgi:hypothetical protein
MLHTSGGKISRVRRRINEREYHHVTQVFRLLAAGTEKLGRLSLGSNLPRNPLNFGEERFCGVESDPVIPSLNSIVLFHKTHFNWLVFVTRLVIISRPSDIEQVDCVSSQR